LPGESQSTAISRFKQALARAVCLQTPYVPRHDGTQHQQRAAHFLPLINELVNSAASFSNDPVLRKSSTEDRRIVTQHLPFVFHLGAPKINDSARIDPVQLDGWWRSTNFSVQNRTFSQEYSAALQSRVTEVFLNRSNLDDLADQLAFVSTEAEGLMRAHGLIRVLLVYTDLSTNVLAHVLIDYSSGDEVEIRVFDVNEEWALVYPSTEFPVTTRGGVSAANPGLLARTLLKSLDLTAPTISDMLFTAFPFDLYR